MLALNAALKQDGIHRHSVEPCVDSVAVQQLSEEHRDEVLSFLAERPLHTVIMAGWIRDNGIVSPLNRGTFYGCRDLEGRLEGVALIGHATLFEAAGQEAAEDVKDGSDHNERREGRHCRPSGRWGSRTTYRRSHPW